MSLDTPADLTREAVSEASAAVARGDLPAALALAKRSLSKGARHPLLFNLIAYELEGLGRYDDALAALSTGLELAPEDPQTLHAIGLCLFKMRRSAEAVIAFDAALIRRPGFAPSLHHKAVALEAMGEDEAARTSYALAAEADGAFADPLAGLASIASRRGEVDEARRRAGQALALDPENSTAAIALARADLADRRYDAAAERLSALLSSQTLYPGDRAPVLGLLGDVLDAQDKTPQAVDAYGAAKAAGASFDAGFLKTAVDFKARARLGLEALAASPPWPRSRATPAARGGAAGHVFLLGFPRSGTTLLEQVLDAHPQIVSIDERATLVGPEERYLTSLEGYRALNRLSGAALEAARAAYWETLREGGVAVEGKVLVDKLPLNTLKLPVIARLFPEAKVLFALRDPRDVVFSCFRRTFRMNAAMREFVTLPSTAAFYDGVMAFGAAARRVLPLTLREVRYETLVADFRAEAEAICAFLGLGFAEEMTDFAARAQTRAISTPSAAQVRRGLYQDGVGQWRRYREALEPVLPTLEPWIDRFGYDAR